MVNKIHKRAATEHAFTEFSTFHSSIFKLLKPARVKTLEKYGESLTSKLLEPPRAPKGSPVVHVVLELQIRRAYFQRAIHRHYHMAPKGKLTNKQNRNQI